MFFVGQLVQHQQSQQVGVIHTFFEKLDQGSGTVVGPLADVHFLQPAGEGAWRFASTVPVECALDHLEFCAMEPEPLRFLAANGDDVTQKIKENLEKPDKPEYTIAIRISSDEVSGNSSKVGR
jgi:hypothetical protein